MSGYIAVADLPSLSFSFFELFFSDLVETSASDADPTNSRDMAGSVLGGTSGGRSEGCCMGHVRQGCRYQSIRLDKVSELNMRILHQTFSKLAGSVDHAGIKCLRLAGQLIGYVYCKYKSHDSKYI